MKTALQAIQKIDKAEHKKGKKKTKINYNRQ